MKGIGLEAERGVALEEEVKASSTTNSVTGEEERAQVATRTTSFAFLG